MSDHVMAGSLNLNLPGTHQAQPQVLAPMGQKVGQQAEQQEQGVLMWMVAPQRLRCAPGTLQQEEGGEGAEQR